MLWNYFHVLGKIGPHIMSKYFCLWNHVEAHIFHFHDSSPLTTLAKACPFYLSFSWLIKSHTLTEMLSYLCLALADCPRIKSCGFRIHCSTTRERDLLMLPQCILCGGGELELIHSVMSQQELRFRNVDSEDSRLWKQIACSPAKLPD